MDRNRHHLLKRIAVFAFVTTVAGCIRMAPVTTSRPAPRPLVAAPGRALVVALSERTPDLPLTARILDENGEVLADVPDGAHAIFEVRPGDHVFAAFVGAMPSDGASVGALRATLAAGRTYAFRVAKTVEAPARWRRRSTLLIELTAVSRDDLPTVLAGLGIAQRRELLPRPERPMTPGDDLDIREAVVGLAMLRIGGDDPRLALPEPFRSLDDTPKRHLWSPARSTLAADDGVALN